MTHYVFDINLTLKWVTRVTYPQFTCSKPRIVSIRTWHRLFLTIDICMFICLLQAKRLPNWWSLLKAAFLAFIGMKPQDASFQRHLSTISNHVCDTKVGVFDRKSELVYSSKTGCVKGDIRRISRCVCGDQSRYFKPNHDVLLTLTKWFLCLNRTRA